MTNDASHPRRRFVRSEAAHDLGIAGNVPDEVKNDALLNGAIESLLPGNYNFEVWKTVYQIRKHQAQCVALQMPEGLTLWATALCDIIERCVRV